MGELDIFQAPVTYILIVLNLVISGYAFFVDPTFLDRFSMNVRGVLQYRQYDRLVVSSFLHVDPMHFAFNMLTLFSFGRILEKFLLGSWKFLILYLGSMFIADLLSLYVKRFSPHYSAVGASGAICGVVFAFCLFLPFAEIGILFIPFGIPAILYAFVYVAYSMYAMNNTQFGGTAHEAHLGGALGGVILTIILQPDALARFIGQISGGA